SGQYQIINHNGEVVSGDEIAGAQRVTLSDGKPSRISIDYAASYLDADGQPIDLPADIEPLFAFGPNGWHVAYSNKAAAYGIIDQQLNWVIEPRFQRYTPIAGRTALSVKIADDDYAVIDTNGDIQHIGDATRRGKLWIARHGDSFDVFWLQGKRIDRFDLSSSAQFLRLYPFLGVKDDDQLTIYARHGDAPVTVDTDLRPALIGDDAPLLALFGGDNTPAVYGRTLANIQALVTIN